MHLLKSVARILEREAYITLVVQSFYVLKIKTIIIT